MQHTYERVRFREGDLTKTVILRDPVEGPSDLLFRWPMLRGIEVDRYGSEIAPKGADERLRMIHTDAVISRIPLRWNTKYAELETGSAA